MNDPKSAPWVERKDCHHAILRFGSGDYYIFCATCDARWVCSSVDKDGAAPELSNKGVGSSLSGHQRIMP